MSRDALSAVARLDLAEALRSRWLLFNLVVYALLAAVFVLVGLRESTVLGFTGTGRVLLSFSHALVLLLPLLALSATGQVVSQARAAGTLELLLGQPIGRADYLVAVSGVRLAILLVPLVVLTVGVAIFAWAALGQAVPWGFLARSLGVGAALLAAFTGLGMLITTRTATASRAMIAVLVTWLLSVALLDFALAGLMLQWRLPPRLVFVLAALNPVEAGRLALLAGHDPELSVLGPVGFYLANRLGPGLLTALGLAWPAAVGLLAWALALRAFRRRDAV